MGCYGKRDIDMVLGGVDSLSYPEINLQDLPRDLIEYLLTSFLYCSDGLVEVFEGLTTRNSSYRQNRHYFLLGVSRPIQFYLVDRC